MKTIFAVTVTGIPDSYSRNFVVIFQCTETSYTMQLVSSKIVS